MIDNQMSLVTLQKIWPLNSLISWSPGTVWRIKRMVSERRCGQSLNCGCPLLLCRHFLCDRLCYGVQGMTIHSVPTTQYEFRETISKKLVWKWNKNYVHIFWQVITHVGFDKNYSFLWLFLDSNNSKLGRNSCLSCPKWVIFFLNFVAFSEYINFTCINLLDLKGF